jgi:hypothetical protein
LCGKKLRYQNLIKPQTQTNNNMNNLLNNKRLLWTAGGVIVVLASITMYFIFRNNVDIAGEWDAEKAKAIALKQLKNTDWQKIDSVMFSDAGEEVVHKTIGQYTMLYKENREVTLLAFYSRPSAHDCYLCSTYLSFFEFEKKSSGWKLISSSIGVDNAGSSGHIPDEEVSVGVIGTDIYGIFVNIYFINHGISTETFSIYGKLNNKYCQLLSIRSGEDRSNSGFDDRAWTSKWKFLSKATGLYDLEVMRKGKSGAKDLTMYEKDIESERFYIMATPPSDESLQKKLREEFAHIPRTIIDEKGHIKAKDIYKFNGQKYERVE